MVYLILAVGVIGYYGINFSGGITEELSDLLVINTVSVFVYFLHIFLLINYLKHGNRKTPWINVEYVSKTKLLLMLEKLFMFLGCFLFIAALIGVFMLKEPGILLLLIFPASIVSSARYVSRALEFDLRDKKTKDMS